MSNLQQRVKELITEVERKNNSLERNKFLSHAQDLLVWAEKLDQKAGDTGLGNKVYGDNKVPVPGASVTCQCLKGAISTNCLLHGHKIQTPLHAYKVS